MANTDACPSPRSEAPAAMSVDAGPKESHTTSTTEDTEASARPTELNPLCSSRRERRKRKKERSRAVALGECVNVYGDQPSASVQVQGSLVKLEDVQNLLLWVLADGSNPCWAFVKNKPLVHQVVLVVVHGLSEQLFRQYASSLLCHTAEVYAEPAVCVARSATVCPEVTTSALFTVPLAKKRKREEGGSVEPGGDGGSSGTTAGAAIAAVVAGARQPLQSGSTAAGNSGAGCGVGRSVARGRSLSPPFPASHYKVPLEELQARSYPLPVLGEDGAMRCPDGFVATQPPADSKTGGGEQLLAMDCEMCATAEGLQVARCSLVDAAGKVVMDELVLPCSPVTDYLTRYSGITAELLTGVTLRLADVQAALRAHITADTLLVGHSLENDLNALRLVHANILDTSVLYPHPKGPPHRPALRVLAQRYLRRSIQAGSHDSTDDARAAMELALLKIQHGPSFGLPGQPQRGEKLADVLSRAKRRCVLVDRQGPLQALVSGNCSAVVVSSDEEAATRVAHELPNARNDLVATQLMGLWRVLEERARDKAAAEADASASSAAAEASASNGHSASAGAASTPGDGAVCRPPCARRTLPREPDWRQQLQQELLHLDRRLRAIYDAAAPNTLMVVVSGHGDTAEVRRLQACRYRRQHGKEGAAWTLADEEQLNGLANAAVRGVCFAAVKKHS